MKRWASMFAGISVFILLFGWGMTQPATRTALSTIRWLPALGALACATLSPVLHAWRWQRLLRVIRQPLSLSVAVHVTTWATLSNYLIPGYAWAPVKGVVARQIYGVRLARAVPTLLLEQALDVLGPLLAGLAGLALLPQARRMSLATPSAAVAALLVVAVGILALAGWLAWRWSTRLQAWLSEAYQATRTLLRSPESYGWAFGLSLMRWTVDILSVWLAAAALHLALSVPAALLLAGAPVVAGMLVPIPGGLGVREASMVGLGYALGYPTGLIATLAVLARGIALAGLGLAALVCQPWQEAGNG